MVNLNKPTISAAAQADFLDRLQQIYFKVIAKHPTATDAERWSMVQKIARGELGGERFYISKTTADQKEERRLAIAALHEMGLRNPRELARRFGVSKSTIYRNKP